MEGRVHGAERLSVVDASIMPDVPSGFTHFPTIMIAERRHGRDPYDALVFKQVHDVHDGLRIVFVTTNLPRRCGIATFSADLMGAVKAADSRVRCRVAAIDEPNEVRPYGGEVRWRIRQGDAKNYCMAAEAINRSNADVVNVQHDFGLYGTWKDDVYAHHLRPSPQPLRK